MEDKSLFRGATDTPGLDFWWHLPWVSKLGCIPFCVLSRLCDPQTHLWCNTCLLEKPFGITPKNTFNNFKYCSILYLFHTLVHCVLYRHNCIDRSIQQPHKLLHDDMDLKMSIYETLQKRSIVVSMKWFLAFNGIRLIDIQNSLERKM